MPRETALYLAVGFAAAWQDELRDWFDRARQSAWCSRQPTVVLVPSRSYGFFLKSLLLESGPGFAGISFWTAGECRSYLLEQTGERIGVATREDLHLLLGNAAQSAPDSAVARAVALDPSSLMRCLDQLTAAGWDFQDIGGESLKPLLETFSKNLKQAKLQTTQQADRRLWERASQQTEPVFESLLVTGFSGAHWPLWNLLNAAVSGAQTATVSILTHLDDDWCAAWRRVAQTKSGHSPSPSPPRRPQIIYHIGANLREQAQAIAAQTLALLAEDSCTRLGILFPGYGALSREVAGQLAALQILHNDAIGHASAPNPDDELWRAWLELQEHGRLEPFINLLRASTAAAALFPGDIEIIERTLDDAFTEVLVDDLAVVAAFLNRQDNQARRAMGDAMARLERLPETTTFANFILRTTGALTSLGMSDRASLIAERATALAHGEQFSFSRSLFLRWLAENANVRARVRDDAGNNPYARVQLLPYGHAENQTWSHLILTGLNDGEWPPRFEATGFLSERAVAKLNKRAAAEGKPLCLGAFELRSLAQRTFTGLVESAGVAVCVTAALTSETEPGRHLVASEALTKLFFDDRGETLGEQQLIELQRQTGTWLRDCRLFESAPAYDESISQTRRAYDARRDATKPFGEYEFALARPPKKPVTLPCKEWETALKDPATIWLKRVLGVEAPRAGTRDDRWSLAIGTWVHRWLRHAANPTAAPSFVPRPKPAEFVKSLRQAAAAGKRETQEAFAAAGRAVPRWWDAGWTEAIWVAENLLAGINTVPDWPYLTAEWELPRGVEAKISSGHTLHLRGRIDLLLAETPTLNGGKLWVLDYKTGHTEKLSASKLVKGTGVQVALYALALHALGARDVAASLVRPGEPVAPELDLADVRAASALWEGLCRMQDTGVFGMRRAVRPDFGFASEYPLATLGIDTDDLAAKWDLTHLNLRKVEQE